MADRDTIKETILNIVKGSNGCKMIELASNVSLYNELRLANLETTDITKIIDEMICSNLLIEIEFVLPDMDYRVKSFLVPGDTEIRIRDSKLVQTELVLEK